MVAANQELSRREFREALRDWRSASFDNGDWQTAFRVGRAIRRPSVFKAAYEKAVEGIRPTVNSVGPEELKADGRILQIFLDWLSDGGAKILLDLIKAFL